MLQSIRDGAQGWLSWIIVILIAIPFALWGVQEYFGANPNVPVVKVNGEEIPLPEYQLAYRRQQAQLGGVDEEVARARTVEDLVQERLLRQAGRSQGLQISDEQLAAAIRTQPYFQLDGRFSQATYESFLSRSGYTPGGFEEFLRQNLVGEQLTTAFVRSAIASDTEMTRLRNLQGQRRTYAVLEVPAAGFDDPAVTEAEIRAHFEEHRERYVTPARVRLAYLTLSKAAIAERVPVDEAGLRSVYQSRLGSFVKSGQRRASHILITVGDEGDEAAARERIDAIREQLEAGASFDALARAESEDPGSAQRGGDLGFFSRGMMDPAFEAAAFELEPGAVSEPVRTSFGLHLIRVTDVREAETKSFEEARAEVLEEYRRGQAEQIYYEQAEQLSNLTFEQPDTLEVAAEALGLDLVATDPIAREGIPGHPILGAPEVLAAAFSEEVREGGLNSEPIEIEGESIVVLRVIERFPAEPQPFAAVRDRIAETLAAEAARRQAEELGRAVLEQLRAGAEPGAVAAEHGLEWSEPQERTRGEAGLPPELGALVFRMPRPGGDRATYDGLADEAGSYRVVRLVSVSDPELDAGAEEALELAREALAQLNGRAAYDAFLGELRERADVVVFDERLQ